MWMGKCQHNERAAISGIFFLHLPCHFVGICNIYTFFFNPHPHLSEIYSYVYSVSFWQVPQLSLIQIKPILQCGKQRKGPASKQFGLNGAYSLWCNYSTLPLQYRHKHEQYIDEQVWLCSRKTKTGGRLDLVYRPQLANNLVSSSKNILKYSIS